MFSNNNYLPNLNHYPLPGQLHGSVVTTPQMQDIGTGVQGSTVHSLGSNFRFLSPTQGTAVPTWIPSINAMGMNVAPGMGVAWQHSVPSTMPWANINPPLFTAANVGSSPQSVLPVSSEDFNSKPIQISPTRRPKRRSLSDGLPEGPASKKRLSEKMAAWFRELQITPTSHVLNQRDLDSSLVNSGLGQNDLSNSWQHFCELEKRLEVDPDEKEAQEILESNEPRLVFLENIQKDALNPSSVLPDMVLDSINKPCLELVLWQSPESVVTNGLKEEQENSNNNSDAAVEETDMAPSSMDEPLILSSIPLCDQHLQPLTAVPFLESRGQAENAEMFDSVDDEMDL